MGLTDWKCETCGQRGHRKSSNPNKCSRGRDRHLDWGSPDIRCCNCVVASGEGEMRCQGCMRRFEIVNAARPQADANAARPQALEVADDHASFSDPFTSAPS